MEKKYTIFDLLGQVFTIFGVTVTCLSVFVILFGAEAEEMSSIFALGNKGLAVATLGQFLLMSVLITLMRFVLFTDHLIKTWSIMVRTMSMFITVIVAIAVFAAIFGWFPVNQVKPWIMFFVSFFICSAVSVTLSVFKEKTENEKMQEALERMKKGEL